MLVLAFVVYVSLLPLSVVFGDFLGVSLHEPVMRYGALPVLPIAVLWLERFLILFVPSYRDQHSPIVTKFFFGEPM